jgi:hypothetical protein
VSSSRPTPTITRDYRPAPDDCARAVSLLLQAPFDSQAKRGDPHDLTNGSTAEMAKNEPWKTERQKT